MNRFILLVKVCSIDYFQKKIIQLMEELKCPLCKNEYTEINPPRLLTMCGHTYCQECLKTMIKRKEYRFQIRCPEDKLKMSIDSTTPLQFPRNMILIEAMNKKVPKIEIPEDRNEFLPSRSDVSSTHGPIASKNSMRSSAFTTKRTSLEEGVCLLHQKHLDIICLQEKISICAECALFGLHKGHSFTTIRDLETKRNDWINEISHIIEQKKAIEEKQTENQVEVQILRLVTKKKEGMMSQIETFYGKVREELDKTQRELKKDVQNEIQRLTQELIGKETLKTGLQDSFKQWQAQMQQAIVHLQSENVMKSIDVYADLMLGQKQNFITKGTELITYLKKDFFCFWNEIQATLDFPKVAICSDISKAVAGLIHLDLKPNEEKRGSIIEDHRSLRSSIFNQSEILSKKNQFQRTTYYDPSHTQEEISLLDLDDNFKSDLNLSEFTLRNESIILKPDHSDTPCFERPELINDNCPRSFKKNKTKELPLNKSLINLHVSRNSMNSPKLKKKTQFLSRGVIPSPSISKDRIKRSFLKVKDPEKFEKLLKAMESDNVESLDFTGLQLGNDLAKQVCMKLKECKKVRTVRLMKNLLSDDCLPGLIECLGSIEMINLAQNQFTVKILDYLSIFCRQKKIEKIKNIQLGHNNINARKYKEKIEELKRQGIFISL